MNNQTNNESLSQGTNSQPDEYSAYRDEEYESCLLYTSDAADEL